MVNQEIIRIPKDWKKVKIGDHFDFKNGLNKAKKFFGQGTPIINYMDVYPHPTIEEKINGRVTLSKEELRNFDVRKEDVLFTRTSETIEEIGLSSVVLEDVKKTTFSGFLLRARPKTKLFELEFKKYCFRSKNVRSQIISSSSQTTRALTNGKLLSKIFILVPTDPQEQKNIAKSISDIEKIVGKLKTTIEKRRNIKQGAMQELLTGKRRLERFNETWFEKPFGSLTTLLTNGFVGKAKDHYVKSNEGVLYVQGYNVKENDFNYHGIKYVSNEFHKKHQKSSLKLGDMLTVQTGDIGVTTIVPPKLVSSNCHALVISRLKKNIANPAFYSQYFNSTKGRSMLKKIETGTTMKHLNVGDMEDLLVPYPEPEEQSAIAEILSDMDFEIKELESKRDKYIMIKNGMMQKLLTGEIRLV